VRSGLIARLRERGVLRVAASYAVIAWLALQIAQVVLEPWDLPDWVRRAPLVVALLGFPVAIALAWFLELGDGRIVRDVALDGAARPAVHGWRRHVDIAVISVLAAAVGFFLLRDAGWLGESVRPGRGVESSSIAVLPFASVGTYVDQHVTDGLSDELRNQFSRMQSLTVTARSSSIAFREQALDAVTIAGKLAVAALLEGTVARGGGRLQVSVQLVDGKSGKVMWAERYDRPDKDLLKVQSEIANAVVAAVLPRFGASGKAAPPPPTADPVAYDLYLLGQQKIREAEELDQTGDVTGSSTSLAQAADLYRSAIAADPKFAQAHARLAGVLLGQALNQTNEATHAEQAAAVDRAVMPDIERALALDPRNAEAYFVKGRLLRNTLRPGAEAAFRRAVELNPNHAPATVSLGFALVAQGLVDERQRLVVHARDLDPMDMQTHSGVLMGAWILGRREELRAGVERMLAVFPENSFAAAHQCEALLELGNPDGALACVVKARTRFATNAEFLTAMDVLAAESWLTMGDDAAALREFDRAGERDPSAALAAMRLRRDVPALKRAASEAMTRRLGPFDAGLGEALVHAGLNDEAIAVYRRAGMAEILDSDQWFKVVALHGVIQFAALLRTKGETAEAERLLRRATAFNETLRDHGVRTSGIRVAAGKVYALAGRNDEALEQLALLPDAMDAPLDAESLESEIEFAELRRDPRFAEVVTRIREMQARVRARLPETFRREGLTWPAK
jgi:TolB-like protein